MTDVIRVLHVDDEVDFADMTARFLEREDDRFDVETATNASEGLNRLANEDFDCVVSDYDMPGQNGIEFLEAVRDSHLDLPFILFTGKGSEEVASEAISADVTDYLQKETGTNQYAVLANRITNVVTQYRATWEAEHTKEQLSQLAEKTDDILFIFNGDWSELLFINSAYETVWGESIAELKEQPQSFLENIHPDDRPKAEASMERLVNGEEADVEYRVVTDDGDVRWVRGESKPIINDDGTVKKIVGFARDITDRKEREHRLRRYERIVENAEDGIYVFDADARFEFVNQRAADVTEIPQNNWLGEDVSVLSDVGVLDEDEVAAISDAIERIVQGTREEAHLSLTPNVSGEIEALDLRLSPYQTSDGEYRIIGFTRDVTEHVEREEEITYRKSLLEAVLETTLNGILVTNQEWEIVTYNERFVEMWNLSTGIMASGSGEKALDEVLDRLERPDEFMERIEYLYEHPDEETQDQIRLADGSVFERYSAPVMDVDDNHFGRVWTYRDVTNRIERERELKRQNERLEKFASVVSHDLRNPLTTAQGMLELAREEKEDAVTVYVDRIDSSLERMERIIEDALWLSRAGKDIGETEMIDLHEVIESSWEFVVNDASDADLVYVDDELGRIDADYDRLCQLLENLLGNALEHAGPDVVVRVEALENGFAIEDDGPGIPASEREQIFEHGYSSEAEGTGFGLSIVEQIIEAHGWKMRVTESSVGGARFEIIGVEDTEC